MSAERVHRKIRKLARRLAEANTWIDEKNSKTMASFGDVWTEAFQLIRLAGCMPEYERREKQIKQARMK